MNMIVPIFDSLKGKNIERYLYNNYNEFYNFLNKTYSEFDITFPEKVYWYYHNIKSYPICECGNRLKFKTLFQGYTNYCSKICSNNKNSSKWNKVKRTCLKKYGVDNVFKSKEYQEKAKLTQIEKYGGVGSASDIIKEKVIDTNIKKYGVKCSLNNPDIRNKSRQTCLKKYGVDNIFKSKEYQEKAKLTQIEKYGGLGWASKFIKNKTLSTFKESFIHKYPDILDIEYNGGQSNTIYICKCPHNECNKCQNKTYSINSLVYWVRKNSNIELCTNLLPITKCISKNTSLELFVKNILDKHRILYIENDRNILNKKEIDIYIPSKKIAIECNGIFWHSEKKKNNSYHYNKFKLCESKGIQLLTIWEDWIRTKPDIVESIILSKLGIYSNRIYARKCIIKEIDSKTCNKFLDDNHIQGKTSSRIRIGLYYNNELLSVMTFGLRKSGIGKKINEDLDYKNNWELSRFCTKLNTQIIGGAEKLFKYFIKNNDVKNIFSFASHDISNGNLYKKLNFIESTITKTSYWYINPSNYNRLHRLNFTKYKLIKEGHDKNLSESQIMTTKGYLRVYDSGQTKYIYKIKD